MEIAEYVLFVAAGFGPTLFALEVASRVAAGKSIIGGRKLAESIRKLKVVSGKSAGAGGIIASVH